VRFHKRLTLAEQVSDIRDLQRSAERVLREYEAKDPHDLSRQQHAQRARLLFDILASAYVEKVRRNSSRQHYITQTAYERAFHASRTKALKDIAHRIPGPKGKSVTPEALRQWLKVYQQPAELAPRRRRANLNLRAPRA
jgi:hypothetical protein